MSGLLEDQDGQHAAAALVDCTLDLATAAVAAASGHGLGPWAARIVACADAQWAFLHGPKSPAVVMFSATQGTDREGMLAMIADVSFQLLCGATWC